MAWLDDLATLVIDAGIVASGAIFFSSRSQPPTGAGPYFTFNGTGGISPRPTQQQPIAYRFPGAQVLIRSSMHTVARDKAALALFTIGSVRNRMINGNFYRQINATESEPRDAGLDDTGRIIMAFNVLGDRRS